MTNKKHILIPKGTRFGKLTVIEISNVRSNRGHVLYICKCDCGKTKLVKSSCLKTKREISCGCSQYDHGGLNKTHGLSNHILYKKYNDIKKRCYNKNNWAYKYYGGKGIKMDKIWKKDFINFYEWAIQTGWNDTLTIERIDFNGNYCPNNCKWATVLEQANNKSSNRKLLYNGVLTNLSEVSRLSGLNITTITQRIIKGWSEKDAVSIPVNVRRKKK